MCRAVFGMPAAELASQVVDVTDVLGHLGIELVERLLGAPDWQQRFDVVDVALEQLDIDASEPDAPLVAAWNLLGASQGRITMSKLAEEVGYSRRHLTHRFVPELGLTPKIVARVLRFEHARALIESGFALSDVALGGGYYDQAHLANEWRDLAGMTPCDAFWGARFAVVADPDGRDVGLMSSSDAEHRSSPPAL